MLYYQLIYQSQAMIPFDRPALLALQQQAQAWNRAHDLSGVLLHTVDGRFLQLLEGSKEAVRGLYYRHIALDPRHRDCHVLAEGPCPQPSFAGWAMALRCASPADVRNLLAAGPAVNKALGIPRARTQPELVAALRGLLTSGPAGHLRPPLSV